MSEIRWLFVIQHKHDICYTRGGPSEDSLSNFSPDDGDSSQAVVVESEVGHSKDLLVSTFSLEASDCTCGGSGALSRLGKTGALELPS